MDTISLLDRNEKTQCLLLKFFVKQTTPVSFSRIGQEVSGSKRYLLQQYELLKKRTSTFSGVHWKGTSEGIVFQKPYQFDIGIIYYDYLSSSINYRLLKMLYETGRLEIYQVMADFFMSESSYYRRIRQLNQLLSEFHLKIRNGVLIGEESQIRFFFFELMYEGGLLSSLEKENTDPEIQRLLKLVQKGLGVTFRKFEYHRFFLLLRITRKRASSQFLGVTENVETLLPFVRTDRVYQRIKELFYDYLHRYCNTWRENEVVLLYLFIFCFNLIPYDTPILNDTYYRFASGSLWGNSHLLNRINLLSESYLNTCLKPVKPNLRDRCLIRYTILWINLSILYFEGGFLYFDQESAFELQKLVPEKNVNQETLQLVQAVFSVVQKSFHSTGSKEINLYLHYSVLLGYLFQKYQKKISIGLDYQGSYLGELALLHYLANFLQERNVSVERYDERNNYDLVITNIMEESERNTKRTFILNDFISIKEMEQLKQMIREIAMQSREKTK